MSVLAELGQAVFGPLVVVFTIANLATMGLQVHVRQVLRTIRNPRFLALVVLLGWVVGPVLGYLVTRLLFLEEPYAVVLLLTSLAPCAPFLPPIVERAHGDLGFAGAFIPVAAIGTVIFMPVIAPLLIEGLTLSARALAQPLVVTVLIPLLVGAALRTYAAPAADAVLRPTSAIARVSTALVAVFCLLLYGRQMLDTAGSLALVSMTLFMVVMGVVAYLAGVGMPANQKSVMTLGMATRNIAAVFAGVLAIPIGDERMLAMVVMWTLWSFILARLAAPFMGRRAGVHADGPVPQGTA